MIPKLVILGLLNKKDMHGYEIIKKVNEEMTNFCDIKIGSIYFAINNLLKNQHIAFKEKIKGKNEPDKIIYQITTEGREEYLKLLKKGLLKPYAGKYPIDIALYFKEDMEETQFRRTIADKAYIAEKVIDALKDMKDETENKIQKLIYTHQIMHQEAELNWLKEILSAYQTNE